MNIIAISVLQITPLKLDMLKSAGTQDLLISEIQGALIDFYANGYYRIPDQNIFIKREGNLIFGINVDGKRYDKNDCHAILDNIAKFHTQEGFLDKVLTNPANFIEPLQVKVKPAPPKTPPAVQYGSSPAPAPVLLTTPPVRFQKPVKTEKTCWQWFSQCLSSDSAAADQKSVAAMSLLPNQSP